MYYSSRRSRAETLSSSCRDHFRPWPISADDLVGLIDLGWSDYRIASYFCVEPVRVSALRAYHGLVRQAQNSWVWRMRRQIAWQTKDECRCSRGKWISLLDLIYSPCAFADSEKISQAAMNIAAITGPRTKPFSPKVASPPSVEISTT